MSKRPVMKTTALAKTYKVKRARHGFSGAIADLVHPIHEWKAALISIDLSLYAGECVGFLGPNGCGKSTFVKLACGLQTPTAGSVEVLGMQAGDRSLELLRKIGVVFGHKSSLWWDLPVIQSFETARRLYAIPDHVYKDNSRFLISSLGLKDIINRPARQLSLGERVKSEVAVALLHDPAVIFLDEPTIGLDLASKQELRNHIRRVVGERGTAVLLTSHDMGDVEICCDRVVLVDDGRIGFDGTIGGLKDELGSEWVVRFSHPDRGVESNERLLVLATAETMGVTDAVTLDADGAISVTLDKRVVSVFVHAVLSRTPNLLVETRLPTLESILLKRFEQKKMVPSC